MVLAIGILGMWLGLGGVALCACVLGSKADQMQPVRQPVIDETSHPDRLAA